jgi:hypothetical protein
MGKPFTPERLENIRRMRRARRLYRKAPLFAFEMMREEYPQYTYENFCDDLRYRTARKRKRGKSQLARYGRYRRMEKLKEQFRQTGNSDFALQAQKLHRNMTKPYRVLARVSGETWEYTLSPLIRIDDIEKLVALLNDCPTVEDAHALVGQFRNGEYLK